MQRGPGRDEDDATITILAEAAAVLRRADRKRRHRRTARRLLSVLVVIAAIGGAVRYWPSPKPDGRSPGLAKALPALLTFVQDKRELRFARVPKVSALADADFDRRLGAGPLAGEGQATGATLQALGHVRSAAEYDARATRAAVADTLGYYNGTAVFVRGNAATPYVRAVVVHELTHALDDQHFGLGRLYRGLRDADQLAGVRSLVEGDATRIERLYVASLSAPDRAAYETEFARRSGSGGRNADEDVSQNLGYFPYAQGETFVTQLLAGGRQALDDAFRHRPPRSSEQALSVPAYRANDKPRAVRVPPVPAGRREVEHGVLGRIGLYVVLAGRIPQAAARAAAEGWGGDANVTWRDTGTRTCTRWDFVMDTTRDRDELALVLTAFLRGRHGAPVGVLAGDVVTMTICG
jgi:hypothetical protein